MIDSLPVLLLLAWLAPLASFTVIVFVGPRLGKGGVLASYVATGAILTSLALSLLALGIWLGHHPPRAAAHHSSEHAEPIDPAHARVPHGVPSRTVSVPSRAEQVPSRAEQARGAAIGLPFASALPNVSAPARLVAWSATKYVGPDTHGPDGAAHDAGEHAGTEPAAAEHGAHAPAARPVYTGNWYRLARFGHLTLDVGYYIDALTVAMFAMVTFIATCIHFYAIGYMHDELHDVTDQEVTLANGQHLHRQGRFHRFFQYLSLFCFSMLGLVVAGNIAMVFVFWELVGICSYFLIGFYIERKSASNAANKAFIVNRVGDFGMIIGLMALFGALGTFNFGDVADRRGQVTPGLFSLVRPAERGHALTVPDGMVRAAAAGEIAAGVEGTPAQIESWRADGWGYGLLVVAGLGIFCGCVGKSAQFPLQVWLPDAMEGPTPVSALVHSATMVAAGVYLVGRFFPVFAPEVLLTIAYCGMITLFLAATIAITATDIKRVLAYSTVSQLGYMMLALGVGGWLAGLYHLFTHAFFKSLLFMCSGSVIHACHTNEMPRMGGLRRKMPYTAYTMLVGCLAIAGAGIPFVIGFSGYYSKDGILAQAFSFRQTNGHDILFYAAAGGAAVTAFYMFRLWYLTFAGQPREQSIYDHAHESPKVMYLPLVVLATLAVVVAWPAPLAISLLPLGAVGLLAAIKWRGTEADTHGDHGHGDHSHAPQGHAGGDAHTTHHGDHGHGASGAPGATGPSWSALGIAAAVALAIATGGHFAKWPKRLAGLSLENVLEQARPEGPQTAGVWLAQVTAPDEHVSHEWAIHGPVTMIAFSTALAGFLLATAFYGLQAASAEEAARKFRPIYIFLRNKWYFDELYDLVFIRPAHWVARGIAGFDLRVIDRLIDAIAQGAVRVAQFDDWIDRRIVDRAVNLLGGSTHTLGLSLRVFQTGRLRTYVLAIVVGALGLVVLMSQLSSWLQFAKLGP